MKLTKKQKERIAKAIKLLQEGNKKYNAAKDKISNVIECHKEFIKQKTGIDIPIDFFRAEKLRDIFLDMDTDTVYKFSDIDIKRLLNEYVQMEEVENISVFGTPLSSENKLDERDKKIINLKIRKTSQVKIARMVFLTVHGVKYRINRMKRIYKCETTSELITHLLKHHLI